MKINEIITESKAKPKKLRESAEVAELGRAMMDMAVKHKDDEVSNNMSSLGDTLTRFGTRLGPKNIKDVVKQTGLQPETIQQYMQQAQQYLEKHGPVRSGAGVGDDDMDDEKEGYMREDEGVTPDQIKAYQKWFKKWNQLPTNNGDYNYAKGIIKGYSDTGDMEGDASSPKDPNEKAYIELFKIFPEFDRDVEAIAQAIDDAGILAVDPFYKGATFNPRSGTRGEIK